MEEVRIALAAHTMLYLPVYVLQEEQHRLRDIKVEIVTADVGDFAAYNRLGKDAHLCICDPMTVVNDALHHDGQQTIGVVVGALVTKVGLWAITTPNTRLWWPNHCRFDAYVQQHSDYNMGNVLTYDSLSTAGRVIEYMNKKGHWKWNHYKVDFSTELEYLKRPFKSAGNELNADLIVTCDLLGAVAAERESPSNALRGPQRVLCFPSFLFKEMLFTGIVVKRDYLKDKRAAVIELLRGIQRVLDEFYETGNSLNNFARLVAAHPNLHPTVGPGQDIDCNDAAVFGHCQRALQLLHKDKVLAQTVRLDGRSHREGWDKAFEVWGIEKHGVSSEKAFALVCDTQVAAQATPSKVVRLITALVEKLKRGLTIVLTIIFGPFGLAALLGLVIAWHDLPSVIPENWKILLWIAVSVLSVAFLARGAWLLVHLLRSKS